MSPSILLVDDDRELLVALTRFFEKSGWEVERAVTGGDGLDRFRASRPDVVLLDLALPDLHGLAVLRRLLEDDPQAAVVVLTGHGDVETAVEAMRVGADNFLTKPVELDHLVAVVERSGTGGAIRRRNRRLAGDDAPEGPSELGESPLMREVASRLERIAQAEGTVMLLGETGTGKGWVARRIHERSARRARPFVEVNCGSLSATFLDSELFGHEKGAFTDARSQKQGLFEVADGGSIFLDEIGDLAAELQPKLLKVLEDRRFRRLGGTRELTVDVRLITATNRDLREQVEAGRFRKDLYYRLAVLPLELPPLRERSPEDLATLSYRILDELGERIPDAPTAISDAALQRLVTHGWPGNIRELRNLLERILILAGDQDQIQLAHLPPELKNGPQTAAAGDPSLTLEQVERRHIARVLEVNEGNRSQSARVLGISRAALYDKMDRFHLRAVGR